jgi:hypothetical protein
VDRKALRTLPVDLGLLDDWNTATTNHEISRRSKTAGKQYGAGALLWA